MSDYWLVKSMNPIRQTLLGMRSKDQNSNFSEHGHIVCLFCCLTSQVNSYGHFLGKFEQAVNLYFVHILSLVTDNNPS